MYLHKTPSCGLNVSTLLFFVLSLRNDNIMTFANKNPLQMHYSWRNVKKITWRAVFKIKTSFSWTPWRSNDCTEGFSFQYFKTYKVCCLLDVFFWFVQEFCFKTGNKKGRQSCKSLPHISFKCAFVCDLVHFCVFKCLLIPSICWGERTHISGHYSFACALDRRGLLLLCIC